MKIRYLVFLALVGILSCDSPVKEVWIESPINKGLKSELIKCSDASKKCKSALLQYTACCQDCLTEKVNSAVGIKRR